MSARMIGGYVLIRDHMAGVFFGTLTEIDMANKTWTLEDARKLHFWAKAAAVEGVVARGPDPQRSRCTPAVALVSGATLAQVILCRPAERAVLEALPEWKP